MVEAPDALNPVGDNAYTIFRYSNTISAGVAYKGDYKSVVLGFPIETLTSQEQIDTLKADRNKLYVERRSAATDEEQAAISEQIAQRNETLRQCRKELSLCRRILDDSQRIAGQVQAAQTAEEAEQLKAKEEKQYEHRRRRG